MAIALRSSDAVATDPRAASFTFRLYQRVNAKSLTLASIEWPLSQPPIREGATRVHFHQGVRVHAQTLQLTFADGTVVEACLPKHRTPATVASDGTVVTASPHALWERGSNAWAGVDATLLCNARAEGRCTLTPDTRMASNTGTGENTLARRA